MSEQAGYTTEDRFSNRKSFCSRLNVVALEAGEKVSEEMVLQLPRGGKPIQEISAGAERFGSEGIASH